MSYYKDLTPYTYHSSGIVDNTLNIGWLDVAFPYSKGKVTKYFINELFEFCRHKLVRMRGFHECNLCLHQNKSLLVVKHNEETLSLGDSEIRVFAGDGKIYAAPNLIYHYVTEHLYKPPDEFIQVVLKGPKSNSDEYKQLLIRYGFIKQV